MPLRELVPRPVKSGLKRLVRTPERVLHPWRRRRARRRLARVAPSTRSVLFVCYGNICRSPVAERLLADSLDEVTRREIRIESTGFHPEEGRSAPPEAVRAAARLDVDVSGHSSRSLQSADGSRGGVEQPVVFVMDPGQTRRYRQTASQVAPEVFVLGDFDPEPVPARRIRDPFGQPAAVFDEVFGRIDRCVLEVAQVLERRGVDELRSTTG